MFAVTTNAASEAGEVFYMPNQYASIEDAVLAFINADSWDVAQQIVTNNQILLLTDAAEQFLRRLIQHYQSDVKTVQQPEMHLRVLRRCRVVGVEAAFVEMNAPRAGSNDPFAPLIEAAEVAMQQYQQGGGVAALNRAVAARRTIVQHPQFSEALENFQLAIFNELAGVYLRRFWATGQPSDLEEAVRVYRRTVENTPDNSPYLAGYLSNLGTGLSIWFRV
ncbi:MAG: hypothetical protein ACPG8W_18180, partial [Candidatus Promineifilaceae bacterium]